MSFKFGEHFNETEKKINFINGTFNKIWEQSDDSEDMIDNLIDKIGGNENVW